MAVKSIIDIDVNDAAFRKFQSVYAKYESALKKAPGVWSQVAKTVDNTRKSFDKIVADQIASQARQAMMLTAQREVDRLTRTTSAYWSGIASSTATAASNLLRMGTSLKALGVYAGIGLLGAGGLYGLDRLAGSVGATRRSSMGLGTTYGQQRAFELNYGKAVDAEGFLANVRDAMTDVEKRVALTVAGVRSTKGKNTFDVATELIPLLKDMADKTPEGTEAQRLRATRADLLIDVDTFKRLREMKWEEINDMKRRAVEDAKFLEVQRQIQRSWQDFDIQMRRAGQRIEKTFVDGLSPLIEPLKNLSDAFSDLLASGLSQLAKEGTIDTFATRLKEFADYMGKPEFAKATREFVDGVIAIAGGIKRFVSFFAPTPEGAKPAGGPFGGPSGDALNKLWRATGADKGASWLTGEVSNQGSLAMRNAGGIIMSPAMGAASMIEKWFGKYRPMVNIARADDLKVENLDKLEQPKSGADEILEIIKRWTGGGVGAGTRSIPAPKGGGGSTPGDLEGETDAQRNFRLRWQGAPRASNDTDRIVTAIAMGAARSRSTVTIMNATGGDVNVVANAVAV